MVRSFFQIAFFGVLAAILVNIFFDDPYLHSDEDRIEFAVKTNQNEQLDELYKQLASRYPDSISLQYNYIQTHFNIPEFSKKGRRKYEQRNDEEIVNHYTYQSVSNDSLYRDVGNYCLGLILSIKEEYDSAIIQLTLVKNSELPYLNNSLGYIMTVKNEVAKAEDYFKKEIRIEGNLGGAYGNLSELYLNQKRLEELGLFLSDDKIKGFVSFSTKRDFHFLNGDILLYLIDITEPLTRRLNVSGFIGAFLILFIWIVYLRRLDVFEGEYWKNIILVVFFGMIASFLTYPFTDLVQLQAGFILNGDLLNDFLYSIFAIGGIEEFVKMIPLLILLRYTKIINESFDYILYASCAALGFAFVENLIYFGNETHMVITGRALTATILHMFLSSIVAYGFVLNRYKYKQNSILRIVAFFLLACLAHGFYDFWLINSAARPFAILSLIFMISGFTIWNSIKRNALNQSEFFSKSKTIDYEGIQNLLVYGFGGVMIFEYSTIGLKFGSSVANSSLGQMLFSGGYLLMLVSSRFGQFKLSKNKWDKIDFWNSDAANTYDIQLDEVIGKEVKLSLFSDHPLAFHFLPNSGLIKERLELGDEFTYYPVELNQLIEDDTYNGQLVLIRPKDSGNTITYGTETLVGLFLISKEISGIESIKRSDLTFIHWAKATKSKPN